MTTSTRSPPSRDLSISSPTNLKTFPPPPSTLLEAHCPIHPNRRALAISQDRLVEKAFLHDLGLKTAPFAAVNDADDLAVALDEIGTPAILKTAPARL